MGITTIEAGQSVSQYTTPSSATLAWSRQIGAIDITSPNAAQELLSLFNEGFKANEIDPLITSKVYYKLALCHKHKSLNLTTLDLSALDKAAELATNEMNPSTKRAILCALTTLNYRPQELLTTFANSCQFDVGRMDVEDLVTIAWAFSCLDYKDLQLFKNLLQSNTLNHSGETLSYEGLFALGGVLDHLKALHLYIQIKPAILTKIKKLQCSTTLSKLHRSVSRTLDIMHISHENEKMIGFSKSVDIAIQDRKLVIEVDGPCHRKKVAKDEFKTRTLNRLGWFVERISYKQWDGATFSDRKIIVEKILEKHEPITQKATKPAPPLKAPQTTSNKKNQAEAPPQPIYNIVFDLESKPLIPIEPAIITAPLQRPPPDAKKNDQAAKKNSGHSGSKAS